jgi:ATP-dependent DNA ligase
VPAGERWVHEIKFDGYRVQVHLRDAVVKVFTRRGQDWTNRFKKIASDVWHIKAGSAIIDGEVVVPAAATLRSAFVSNWCELSFIRQGRLRHRSPDRAAAVKPDT